MFFAVADEARAQARDTTEAGWYEYVVVALDESSLTNPPWLRIYYGNGQVEEFGKGSTWSSREGTIRDLDLTVSAINYLAGKGYELFRTRENDRGAESTIQHRYLSRRRK